MIAGDWNGLRRRGLHPPHPNATAREAKIIHEQPYHHHHHQHNRLNFDFGKLTIPWLLAVGILFRLIIGLFPYSGEGVAPRFGDFEAQRHWMEITLHLPRRQWYVEVGDGRNQLDWWGLDYPPLSAYFARFVGSISQYFDPKWTRLIESKGYEGPGLRLFMRLSVLAADALILVPALLWFWRGRGHRMSASHFLVMLCCPVLMLIDHGHFQYNNVMLGLVTLAAVALVDHRAYRSATLLLVLAALFKQTALYFAPAFAMGLLRACIHRGLKRGLLLALQLAALAIITASLILAPFLVDFPARLLPIMARVFPVGRGLFEDKVGNWWWAWAQLTKMHRHYDTQTLFRWCAITTLLSQIPMAFSLLVMRPLKIRFLYALAYSALSAFLFSYHVHEKAIMLPCMAALLLVSESPLFVCWFTLLALFSLAPLMDKDGLRIPYALSMMLWAGYWRRLLHWSQVPRAWKAVLTLTASVIMLVHVGEAIYIPPLHYPFLWPTINCLLSAGAFGLAWLYLLIQMLRAREETIKIE